MKFYPLTVARVTPEAGGAVAVSFAVPPALREIFAFAPGQFLTLRATVDGADIRRSYSICSPRSRYVQLGELEVGVRPVAGGVFSNWAATQLKPGDVLQVMAPDGRFVSRRARALHRVGFAAGSGITPILSIMASSLTEQPQSKFTLVYGNRNMASVMFNEALQDLKDRYPDRLTLIHVLSRQAQEVPLLEGRIDAAKVRALIDTLLPAASMDEVFICGPEPMIEATEAALQAAGVPLRQIHSERFASGLAKPDASKNIARKHDAAPASGLNAPQTALEVVLDGKTHSLTMPASDKLLDAALAAGLDLPYACKGGVCCTCRAKLVEGRVHMEKNFTLEPWEIEQGFVLTCQARPLTDRVVVSYDER